MKSINARLKKLENKYNAMKCSCHQGHTHDSKKEARRCNELNLLQRAGEISELRYQVKYLLIPTIREESGEYYTKGAKKGQPKPGKVIEQECSYYADFDYITREGKHVVEDTKGMKTKEYIIKRKLLLHIYGIRITEV